MRASGFHDAQRVYISRLSIASFWEMLEASSEPQARVSRHLLFHPPLSDLG